MSTVEKYLQSLTASFGGYGAEALETRQAAARFYKSILQERTTKDTITGYVKLQARERPAWETQKIPIKVEWLVDLQRIGTNLVQRKHQELKNSHPVGYDLTSRRVRLAIAIGFYFLCRKSEYLPGMNRHVKWCLAWEDVNFLDAEKKELSWEAVAQDRTRVECIMLHIQFSKTDKKGVGRKPVMQRLNVAGRYCVVEELVKYFQLGIAGGYIQNEAQHMMSLNAGPAPIGHLASTTYDQIFDHFEQNYMHGIDKGKIVPHSLRVGGATALAQAGLTVIHLCNQGGWSLESATSIHRYAQATVGASGIITAAFTGLSAETEANVWD